VIRPLAQFGIASADVAVGFEGDSTAEQPSISKSSSGLPRHGFARVQYLGDEDCWNWSGPIDDDGFGYLKMRQWGVRSRMYAHRFAYTVTIGEIPTDEVAYHGRRCAGAGNG
jgi:hypothetical protein